MMLRYVLAWIAMSFIAVANGALRERAFSRLPELRAHQLSTMGLVVMKKPFRETLRDYNLAAGRVWILFLAWITAAPWVFLQLFG